MTLTLYDFIMGILGGGMSYVVARFLFDQFVPGDLTPQVKRIVVYMLSFVLAVAALWAGKLLGYIVITPETVFAAFVTAFTTSQALHGYFELGAK